MYRKAVIFYFDISVLKDLKNLHFSLGTEKERLKNALDQEMKHTNNISSSILLSLEAQMNQTVQQNNELKNRLQKIHEVSDLSDLSSLDRISDTVVSPN